MAGYNFKSEEDVKEFLKNLHTEYSFGCYKEKNGEACHLLGDYYESVKKNYKEAAKIYKNNCDNLEYGKSCSKFGGYSLIGKSCEKNLIVAFKYMKRGCELKDPIGCTNAGILSVSEPKIQGNNKTNVINEGMKMLHTACDARKSDKACFFLSGVYLKGIEGVMEKNYLEAYKVSLAACELGNPYACANVSQMHMRGEGGIQKNAEMAETFKQRALELQKQLKESQVELKFGGA